MRKQVLVAVDRGETRVAILEAEGSPSADPVEAASLGETAAPEAAESGERPAGRGRGRGRGRSGAPPADWRVAELYIERYGKRSIVGNVYKGKVDNVVPGLEAAFVDIGLEKNGFLHTDDIVLPGVEVARRGRSGGKGQRISELLRPGQEIVVQVAKDPLKTKGARLTMQLSIAGRYLVFVPQGEGVGVSRRLDDRERDRLRKEAARLGADTSGGVIVRTAAHGGAREDFERELKYLHKLHEVLERRVEETTAPDMVFQEADLSVRVVRDIYSAEFERAFVDDQKQFDRLSSFLTRTAPDLVPRVELYRDDQPLLERFEVDRAIQSTLNRRVELPSGGSLVIDYAEALTVIDVNSGSFTGRGRGARLEDTITKTNLEAADEVVRQLRLRDIGGIIVIDFIDMARQRNREAVMKTLRQALENDRTKSDVVEMSQRLGLVQMTRQNVTDGVREILTKMCPTCTGEGVVLSEESVALEVERKLRDLALERRGAEAFLVQVNPRVTAVLINGPGRPLAHLETEVDRHFHFEGSEGLPLEHFDVVMEGTRAQVEERALPFREGEEVLVAIDEPHMYNEDDAVAKVDGYVITVAAAGRHIGEKRLVRIERVGRTAASGSLVENGAGPAQETGAESPDEEVGRARRRGRRGGRGRGTRDRAEAAAEAGE